MSLVSDFHNNDFAAYSNIPTSWKETGLDPAKIARDKLGNADIPEYQKDSFIRKAQTQAEIPEETAKSLKGKIKTKYKEMTKKLKDTFKGSKTKAEAAGDNIKKSTFISKIGKAVKPILTAAKKHKGITAAIAATAAFCIGAVIQDNKRKSEYQDTSVNKYSRYGFRRYY